MVCMNSFLHGNGLACALIINRLNKENPDNVKLSIVIMVITRIIQM